MNKGKNQITNIVIASLAETKMGKPNSGESVFGNSTEVKRDAQGNPYISGQTQKNSFIKLIEELNERDFQEKKIEKRQRIGDVHNPTYDIAADMNADISGYVDTASLETVSPENADKEAEAGLQEEEEKENDSKNKKKSPKKSIKKAPSYLSKRTSPLRISAATMIENPGTFHDLLLRFNEEDQGKNAIVNVELASSGDYVFGYNLKVNELGSLPLPLKDKDGIRAGGRVPIIDLKERMRRISLIMEASRLLNGFANQTRTLSTFQPKKVVIGLCPKSNLKLLDYYGVSEQRRKNICAEFENDGGVIFIGDDESETSVLQAYKNAWEYLVENGVDDSNLWQEEPMSLEQFFDPVFMEKKREEFLSKFD